MFVTEGHLNWFIPNLVCTIVTLGVMDGINMVLLWATTLKIEEYKVYIVILVTVLMMSSLCWKFKQYDHMILYALGHIIIALTN